MKGYSQHYGENCASARLEGVDASYKDLAQVCGNIRSKKTDAAIAFLEKAATGEVPVYYKSHNKKLGHRRELGGKKGRYPKKAAAIVLKVLRSAIANGDVKGIGSDLVVRHASANKKMTLPRIAPKGRWARSNFETSRVEIIVEGSGIPKGVELQKPAKKAEAKKPKPEVKKAEAKKVEPKKEAKSEPKKPEVKEKAEKPEPKKEAKKEEPKKAEKGDS